MPKTHATKSVIRVLENKGFFFVSQNGSHAKYRKIGSQTLTVIVPTHAKDIRHGTFQSILRQAKLSKNDFDKK